MKTKSLLLMCIMFIALAAAIPAKTVPVTDNLTAKIKVTKQQSFPNVLFFLEPIFKLLNRGGTYRSVEKNFMRDAPEKMPKEYKCPVAGSFVRVHANSAPTAMECARITSAFQKIIRNTTGNFAEANNLLPREAFQNWTLFSTPKEYRVWLLQHATSVVGAESPSIAGCPIIATPNSATGYASAITAGFKIMWGGEVKVNYPFAVVARLSPEQESRPECANHQEEALYNEFEHFRTANRKKVLGRWYQSFIAFMGENDKHPIFINRQ